MDNEFEKNYTYKGVCKHCGSNVYCIENKMWFLPFKFIWICSSEKTINCPHHVSPMFRSTIGLDVTPDWVKNVKKRIKKVFSKIPPLNNVIDEMYELFEDADLGEEQELKEYALQQIILRMRKIVRQEDEGIKTGDLCFSIVNEIQIINSLFRELRD